MTSHMTISNNLKHPVRVGEADCAGIKIHYQDEGLLSDKPIVLVSGLGTQLTLWPQEFIDGLIEEGYRVIRFDNRDIGLSSSVKSDAKVHLPKSVLRSRLGMNPQSDYTLYHMAQDIVGLLDHLKLAKVHLMGASMGGMIAQLFAAIYPHRTLSLTSVMSSTNHPLLPPPRLDVMLSALGIGVKKGHTKEIAVERSMNFWKKISSPAFPTPEETLYNRIASDYDRSYRPSGYLRQANAIVATGGFSHVLKRVSCPTQIIHGDKDPFVRLSGGIASAKSIPAAELEIIKGMGHDLPIQLNPRLIELIVYNTSKTNQIKAASKYA